MTAPRLVLVGAPGAGKSTVGRRVAEQCDLPFADTDLLIEEATGMSVADIFITLGEPEFRRIEEEVVAEALREQSGILALGGGVVMSPATRLILGHHFVVWLRVSVTDAAHRVGMNTARPLLLGNVRGQLKTLMEDRAPLYRGVSTAIIDSSGKSLKSVVVEVINLLDVESHG